MKNGWIGTLTGMLLAGAAHAQPAPVDRGTPPVNPAPLARTAQPAAATPWPAPAFPACDTPSPVAVQVPHNVIPVSNPAVPPGGQIIEMPGEAPSWFDRFRVGRRRAELPMNLPTAAPQTLPPMSGAAPLMLPDAAGEQIILMEKPAQSQLPPQPGAVPPAGSSPAEPLQQLPPPRPLDMAEPAVPAASLPPGQWWFGVEYLLWFVEHLRLPIALLTTGAAVANPPPGALSNASTLILVDAESLRHGHYPGARLSTGFWFSAERIIGLEANAFFSQSSDVELTLAGSNTTSGVLSRPLVDATTNLQTAAVVAFPSTLTGSISITSTSWLYGGEINLAAKFIRGVEADWDLIAGIRYLGLRETLDIDQNTLTTLGNILSFNGRTVPAGSLATVFDHFDTRNRFTGGQFGVRKESRLGNMVLGCQLKVAAGVTRQNIDVNGGTSLTAPGFGTGSLPGGILAQPSNIGKVVANEFTVVPQLQFTLGYQCLESLRLWACYECLLWSNTVRPGDQIDPLVNLTQAPTSPSFNPLTAPARPLLPFEQRTLFVQGITVGMEVKY